MHYSIIPTPSGLPTLEVDEDGRKACIHSKVDPMREAEAYADRYDPARYDVLVVLGMGLGYHLIPLAPVIADYRRIVVIDPTKGLDGELGRREHTKFLAAANNVHLAAGRGTDEVEALLEGLIDLESAKGIAVVEHAVSVRFFSRYFSAVRASVDRVINNAAGNMATVRAFGRRYLKNALINSMRLEGRIPAAGLQGLFTGCTALVTAPGPSLEGHIPVIKQYRERFFVVAVDSALPVLAVHGIAPEFVVSIDPQPYIQEHFLHVCPSGPVHVHTLTVHHGLASGPPSVMALNSHPLCQWVEGLSPGAIGTLESGTGTVAGDAIAFCAMAGFESIALAGLDFCFLDGEIYSRGTAYQRRYAQILNSRLMTAETRNMDYIRKSSKNFSHEGLSTRRSFLRYRDLTARLLGEINAHTDTAVVRLGKAGLGLSTVESAEPNDFFRKIAGPLPDKEALMKKVLSMERIDGRVLAMMIRESLSEAALGAICEASLQRKVQPQEIRKYQSIIIQGGMV